MGFQLEFLSTDIKVNQPFCVQWSFQSLPGKVKCKYLEKLRRKLIQPVSSSWSIQYERVQLSSWTLQCSDLCLVKIKNRKAPTSYISCSYIAFTISSLLPLNRVFNKNHTRLFPKKVKPSQDFCPKPFLEFNRLSKRQILLTYVGSQTQRTLRT